MALWQRDEAPDPVEVQSFHTERAREDALDAAEVYLDGAGIVANSLKGRLVRSGDDTLAVHYGRITTRITVEKAHEGSRVRVTRKGQAPLEDTRTWLVGLGLGGFVLAWALAWYNARATEALPPLVMITFFFLALIGVVVALYVVDRSLERRSTSLTRSLEDAMRGDPLLVLQREVDGLERSSSIANGILAYCAMLILEFLIFVILLSDGVRQGIDEAVTLEVMRAGFGLPVVPAVLFGLGWFWATNRLHGERMALVERRFRRLGAGS